jgi:hypothetical protein
LSIKGIEVVANLVGFDLNFAEVRWLRTGGRGGKCESQQDNERNSKRSFHELLLVNVSKK